MKVLRSIIGVLLGAFLCLTLALATGAVSPAYADDPVPVSTVQDLLSIADQYASGQNAQKVYELTADLDLTGEAFTPIGSSISAFNGVFYGNGHSITLDLTVSSGESGVFGTISPVGAVRDLVVRGSVSTSSGYCGGVCGINNGLVSGCVNFATVTGSGGNYFGGVVGQNGGVIESCVNFGEVNARLYAGGIAGQNRGSGAITECVNLGDLRSTAGNGSVSSIGGLVGECAAVLSDSYSCATVYSSGDRLGGAVGYLNSSAGQNVYSVGTRDAVGAAGVNIPNSYKKISLYEILAEKVEFSDDTLVYLVYDEGVGYLPCPDFIEKSDPVADGFRRALLSGEGTMADPYVIGSEEDFELFSTNSKLYSYSGKRLVLTHSLEITDGRYVGDEDTAFAGDFDGQGYTVKYVLNGGGYLGLFSRIASGGTVEDLRLDAVVTGTSYVGALAGESQGVVSGIVATGTVTGTEKVGGLIGETSASLTGCSSAVNVTGLRYVGGIAGVTTAANSEQLVVSGSIGMAPGSSFGSFGGIFGKATGLTATELLVKGDVTARKSDRTGGLIGDAEDVTIASSAVLATVSGRNNVGGLFGYGQTLSATDVFCVGSVNGATYVGGLIGGGSGTVTSAYYSGRLGEVGEAQVDKNTFRSVAPAASTLTSVYYNSDLIYVGTDGVGKSAAEFTRCDLLTGAAWKTPAFSADGGSFPYVDPVNGISSDSNARRKLSYSYFAGGTGTEQAPYQLNREIHFRNFSYLCGINTTYLDNNYVQTDAVTFERSFTPVAGVFGGTFDGVNLGLYDFSATSGCGALFEEIGYGATVKNVVVRSGEASCASLAATNAGTVEQCASFAVVQGSGNLGGLVGTNSGEINVCLFAGRVIGDSTTAFVGGIAAINTGSIADCVVRAYQESAGYLGGLVGKNAGEVDRNLVSGTLHGKGSSYYVGGLAGTNEDCRFDNALFLGLVYVDNAPYVAQPRVGGVIGYFDSNYLPTIEPNVYFNKDVCAFSSLYGSASLSVTGKSQTGDYIYNNVVNQFTDFDYVYQSDEESRLAPVPEAILLFDDNDVLYYVAEAARIYYFGRDGLSFASCGSEDNPYLLSTEAQLNKLREMVDGGCSYEGRYFKMIADIVLHSGFRPIGSFLSAGDPGNQPFNGVFDGDGHTIDDMVVSERADYGYVAMFAYAGANAQIKNVTFGAGCSFTSQGNYVGSFVGNNTGYIGGCISYATLSGSSIGGIAAVSAVGTSIVDCVFAGTFDESLANAFGITSQSADKDPRFYTTDSWYVRDRNEFVKVGEEPYTHNGYGSVLFVDRGGDVTIARTAQGIRFTLVPDVGLSGRILNVKDALVYRETGTGYDTAADENVTAGKSVTYYARFTSYTRAVWTGADDLIAEGYGEGEYYQGQRVTFAFSVKAGYFIDDDDYSAIDGQWRTATDTVNFVFTKPAGAYDLPITVSDFSAYGGLSYGSSLSYDGTDKEVALSYVDAAAESKFNVTAGENGISFYLLPSMARTPSINAAGSYRIVARIYLAGQTRFCGTLNADVSVAKSVLAADFSDGDYWSAYAGKVYDGSVSMTAVVSNDHITGLAQGDENAVIVRATVTLDAATAGNRTATISDFSMSGSASGNYELTPATLSDVACVVSRKSVVYTISESNLTAPYSGTEPSVVGSPSASLGLAQAVFTFAKRTGEGTPDATWAALPAGSKTWYVGSYDLTVSCSDSVNYDLVGAEDYVFVITPYVLTQLVYSGYDNLVYNGTEKSVLGYYDTVNGALERVEFAFYRQKAGGAYEIDGIAYESQASVLKAGSYLAVPAVQNNNYVLSDSVSPLQFTVAKNASAGEIAFEFDSATTVTIGSGIPLTVSVDIFDAELIVAPYGATRGRARLEQTGPGTYDFIPTSYATGDQFYFRLAAVDSENYEDRYSGVRSVNIIAGTIYVGISEESSTMLFGDVPDLTPIYSFTDDFAEIISDTSAIAGFVAPTLSVDATVLRAGATPYSVSVIGGDSNGYKIAAVRSKCLLTVLPRPVRVSVTDEHENGKVYGEADGTMSFTLLDGLTGSERLETLPNGQAVVLAGGLTRAAGESVGRYEILTTDLVDKNPDYEIHAAVSAQYVVEKRSIELRIDAVEKVYGMEDPEITFTPVAGTSFADPSDIDSLTLEVQRAPGEDVGKYAYSVVSYSGNDNYVIDRIDFRTNGFWIVRATPSVSYNLIGSLSYGDELLHLRISGEAYSNGAKVAGSFGWKYPEKAVLTVGTSRQELVFTPVSNNYSTVVINAEIETGKRVADINFSGRLVYDYTGRLQCEIEAAVVNAVEGDTVGLLYETDSAPVDAGSYRYIVTGIAQEYADRYVLPENGASIAFRILPATVTVSVKDAVVDAGGRYVPEITYAGFVNGETVGVLTKRATVESVPAQGGTYTVIASGAEAKNYDFSYQAGIVRIAKKNATSSVASVQGNLPAETVLTSAVLTGNSLTMRASELDIVQNYNVFVPNFKKLTDYVQVESNVEIEGEVTYSVQVKLPANAKVYLVKKDGSVVGPIEYEVLTTDLNAASEDGESATNDRVTITFTSEEIMGVAVYSDKEVMEIVKSLLPDIAVGAAVVLIIVIVVIVCVSIGKKNARKRAYTRYLDER